MARKRLIELPLFERLSLVSIVSTGLCCRRHAVREPVEERHAEPRFRPTQ